MSKEKNEVGYPDGNRINLNDPVEMLQWQRRLHATPDELRLAVETVGSSVEKVSEFLQRY